MFDWVSNLDLPENNSDDGTMAKYSSWKWRFPSLVFLVIAPRVPRNVALSLSPLTRGASPEAAEKLKCTW